MPATASANPRVILAKIPVDYPVAGEHIIVETSHTIDLDTVPLNGGFLTKTLLISPEPYMRERMRERSVPSYSTTNVLGAPLVGLALVVVLRSEKEGVKVGDHLFGMSTWEAYTVQPYVDGRVHFKPEEWPSYTFDMDSMGMQAVQNTGLPWTKYFTVLGQVGFCAFAGFEGLADAKEGETIFVSSGASSVGSIVIQLAKAKGLKVIASAGTDAKVDYMRSLGADAPFNYKTMSYDSALRQHGPIDVYWDNVGGEALEAAIDYAGFHARFVHCGSSSEYNMAAEQRHGIKNTTLIFKKRLILRGFILPDIAPQFAERFYAEMPQLVMQGKIKSCERVVEGLENAPQAFVDMLHGGGAIGKVVIQVAKI